MVSRRRLIADLVALVGVDRTMYQGDRCDVLRLNTGPGNADQIGVAA
jgi:hypothetical protein